MKSDNPYMFVYFIRTSIEKSCHTNCQNNLTFFFFFGGLRRKCKLFNLNFQTFPHTNVQLTLQKKFVKRRTFFLLSLKRFCLIYYENNCSVDGLFNVHACTFQTFYAHKTLLGIFCQSKSYYTDFSSSV